MPVIVTPPAQAATPQHTVRVVVADDHTLVRQGLVEILSTDDSIEVVGEATNGRQAVTLATETKPDVVLLDVEMPVMGAQPALRRMLELSNAPKVVIVTVFTDYKLIRELLNIGASAFLSKNSSMAELISTVHAVAHTTAAEYMIVSTPRNDIPDLPTKPDTGLSATETEILLAVARGLSNRQISQDLFLSESTVKRQLSRVYGRLGVGSRNAAIRQALAQGIITPWDLSRNQPENE